uniref:Orn/DAP/Arg decarboxylase 2 C-terminal domain-containing protein n=3 Tax=Arion vulgaris TaxID=1028688 RepID=A0A0B7ALA2_9EUPU
MKLNVVGISFHVGSLPDDAECFASTIADAHFVFQIGQSLGFNMTILDIGGGFPGIDDDGGKFEKIADVVNKSLDLYFPVSQGVRIIAEPGRYLITSAVTLAVNIIGKRIVRQNFKKKNQNGTTHLSLSPLNCNASHDKGRDSNMTHDIRRTDDDIRNNESLVYMYYVNDGVYGTLANVMTDSVVIQHKVLYREAQPDADASPKKPSIIWGPSCDSLDCVVPDCNLPDLKVGEWLYFCNMGAYTLCLATDFNGIERPLVFPVCSKHYWNQMYPEGSPMLYLPYV